MNSQIQIIESKNTPDNLKVVYSPTQLHFANIDVTKNDKVSILDNSKTSSFVKLNGKEYLKKAVEDYLPIWRYNNSPFRKIDEDRVIKFYNILLAMGVIGAALDNASQDIKPILEETGLELGDIAKLQENLNNFMRATNRALGTDLVINAFDYGEEIYRSALEKASHLNELKKELQ